MYLLQQGNTGHQNHLLSIRKVQSLSQAHVATGDYENLLGISLTHHDKTLTFI